MIKLQDFAHAQGVTDRQVQRLLKKYASELEGLYERKGPNGTWLSEKACEILRGKMKQQPIAVTGEDERKALQAQIQELEQTHKNLLIKTAEQADRISELAQWKADHAVAIAAAEQNRLLLEGKTKEIKILEGFIQDAKTEIGTLNDENRDLSVKNAEKDKILAETSERLKSASDELTAIKSKWWYKLFAGKK